MVGYFPSSDGSQSTEDLITGWKYVYDGVGNIIALYESRPKGSYQYRRKLADFTYDNQNQLLSETYYTYLQDGPNHYNTATWHYTYDTAGNIRFRYQTVTTKNSDGKTITTTVPAEERNYTYGNGTWKDLLTAVNDSPIVYEGQTYENGTVSGVVKSGNPIRYTNGTKTYTNLTWEHGRQLASITTGNKTYTYDYDADGIRTEKVVDGVVHSYVTQNGRVVQESFPYGNTTVIMIFSYDEQGKPFSIRYSYDGGTTFSQYYYAINAQGDVEGIFFTRKNATTGKQEVRWMGHYTYDAWGNILSIVGPDTADGNPGPTITNPASLMIRNPLRYRGYYYDTETGFYYLQSRYYDPANHRFINADDAEYSTMSAYSTNDTNLFTYCGNNPVTRSDDGGQFWNFVIGAVVGAVANVVTQVITNAVNGESLTNGLVSAAVVGAAGGAIAATGMLAPTQAVLTGLASFAGDAIQQWVDKGFKNIDLKQSIRTGIVATATSYIGSRVGEKLFGGIEDLGNSYITKGHQKNLIGDTRALKGKSHSSYYRSGRKLVAKGKKLVNFYRGVSSCFGSAIGILTGLENNLLPKYGGDIN